MNKPEDAKNNARLIFESVFQTPNQEPSPYERKLQQDYPDVPESEKHTWAQNDETLHQCDEWKETVEATARAIQDAVDACQRLMKANGHSTPSQITQERNLLLSASHKMEDLLFDLFQKYPLPGHTYRSLAKNIPGLEDQIPQLIQNTEEQIIIWLPRLPSKKRGANSIVFQELRELLLENTFSHFPQWHADFIHTYHSDDMIGVLDADNYAYKPIIDALALALSSSDGYEHFSFGIHNYSSEKLKPGCYIYVQKKSENVQHFHDLIKGFSAETQ